MGRARASRPPESDPPLLYATWWLVRARWRIAVVSFLRGARWRRFTYVLVGLALAFLSLVGLLMSYALAFFFSRLPPPDPTRADVVVATALTGGLVLHVLVSFTVALAALFLSRDLDLLLAAPVPRRAVFLSKLLGGLTPTLLLVTAVTLVPLVGYGLAMKADWPYYLASAIALAVMPVLPAAVGALAVTIIVRRVPAHRLAEIIGLIVVAMTLSVALVAGSARQLQEALTVEDLLAILSRLRNPLSPAEWLTRAIVAAGRGDLRATVRWFALSSVVSTLALVPMWLGANRLYYEGWLRLQSSSGRGQRNGRLPWTRFDRAEALSQPRGLMRFLPRAAAAIVEKDFRIIPRDLTNMAQVLSPLAIGVFFILQQLLYPIRIGGADRPLTVASTALTMLSAAVAGAISATIMARFGLTAFSTEGQAYWILKSSPVAKRHLLAGKFVIGYLPYVALAWGLVVVLEGARIFSNARLLGGPFLAGLLAELHPWAILYAGFVVAVAGLGTQAIALALGAARPNLGWDTPHEMLTPDVSCLSLVLYGAYGFIVTVALATPAAVSGFPMLARQHLVWGLGLAIGLGLTALVAASCWRLACAELDAVGE